MKKMGREREIPSVSGLSRRQCRKRNTFRKGMAYFLTFLMLMGNMQTISYAEGNAKEIAEQLGIEEKEKTEASLTEKSELNKDQKEENSALAEEELSEKENVEVNNKNAEESAEDLSEDKSENKEELGEAEKKENEAESAEKESEKTGEEDVSQDTENEKKAKYLDDDSFSAEAGDLTVTASFSGGTFFEGTHMKVELVKEEETVEEARKELEKEFKKEDPDADSEVEILETVDISFYREINGEVKEVQPKKGKQVEISIQKTEKIKEALSETEAKQEVSIEEEFKIVHLSEEHPTEILPVKEEGDNLLFAAKHFSVFSIGKGRRKKRDITQAPDHEFKAFWMDPEDPKAGTSNATTGHSYLDGTASDARSHTKLKIIPPERTSNAVDTTTLGVNITLKGDQNTKYAPGRVEIRIPTRIFEGWDGDPDKLTVNPSRVDVGGAKVYYPLMPAVTHGIPKAPDTNPQSSFNYTIEGDYFVLKNFKDLNGGLTFRADIAYNLTPTMLKMQKHEVVDGKEKGIYEKTLPVSMKLLKEDLSAPEAEQSIDMSVRVETEVKPTKVSLEHAKVDVNRGVYFTWNNTWGPVPADAAQYFYGIWFLKVERARGSSQPFDYTIEDIPGAADNGTLVGAKKLPLDWRYDFYFFNHPTEGREDTLDSFGKNGYPGIAENMAPGAVPPAGKEYLGNPIGKDQVGIVKDPSVKFLPHYQPYVESGNYGPTGHTNYQVYALLYKYPYEKLKKAMQDNPNFATEGLTIKNEGKLKVTEKWADGHERVIPIEPKGEMTVFNHPGVGGLFNYAKYNTLGGWGYLGILGLQSLYKDGVPFDLHYSWWVDSFSLSTEYQANDAKVSWNPDGTYKTSDNGKPGSSVTLTDGKYQLFSTNRNGISGKLLGGKALSEMQHDTGNATDAYRGGVYDLKDKDYHYTKLYIKDMKMYDVEKVENQPVTFSPISTPNSNKFNYPPVSLYLRKEGENSFFKYGEFYYDASGYQRFRKEAGSLEPEPITEKEAADTRISSGNQLDLVKTFGANTKIVGIKLEQDSNFYRSSFEAAFSMEITPTADMQNAIKKTIARTDGYITSFLAAPASAEIRQEGESVSSSKSIGKYLGQVGYVLEPLDIYSSLQKTYDPFKDHPERSEQSIRVHVTGTNYGNLPTAMKQDRFTKKYQLRKGIIYDLLPAGTSVDENSIEVGAWDYPAEILPNRKIGKDKYSVRFEKNWNGSGQTMMIVDFEFPEDADHVFWHQSYNQSGWRLNYTLINPYTNITDRGRNVKNTVAFVHTDEDRNWQSNFTKDKQPNIEKKSQFMGLLDEPFTKGMSVAERIMPFGPVMVLEANFSNTVSTELDSRFLTNNTSYMGDPYRHRLLYQASNTTRTSDLVLFDILGKEEDRNGDFRGVDIASLLEKRSYDKKNPNNQDTLEPRVFVSEVLPSSEQLDLGKALYEADHASDTNPNNPKNSGSIWKKWDYVNEANNTIDKKKIVAVAFDLRTTKAGKRFLFDKQGLALAYVNMEASSKQEKYGVENTNVAYRKALVFSGDEVPQNAAMDRVESSSSHKLVKPVTFSIPVMKKLEVPADLTGPDITNWFTFTLSAVDGAPLKDSSGNAIATEKKNPNSDGGPVKFEGIRILRPGKYTYRINESGREALGVTSKDMGDKYITITVTDPDHKALVTDLKYTDNKPLTFTNIYGVTAVKPHLKVKKVLSAAPGLRKPDISGSFSFTLKGESSTDPMPAEAGGESQLTVTNPGADGGEISLGTISLTSPGEYRYTITEDGRYPGVVNDPKSQREITITVRDFRTGELIALVTGDDLTFTNTFEPNPNEGQISLKKKISGSKPTTDSSFRFLLKAENEGLSQPMPGGSPEEEEIVELTGEGSTSFEAIRFTKPGIFRYTVTEINDGVAGYTYDPSVYTVSFTVTQSEDNIYDLISERKIYKNGVEVSEILFDNQYSVKSHGGGGGGGNPPKPIPVGPVTPGGPGEKPQDPEKPTVPDVPQNPENPTPNNGGNVPPAPSIPERIREIEKRIGEILNASRKRPLTPEEKEELKRLGEVLGELRREQSRKVNTSDQSRMIWYALASALSCLCLAFYYLVDRKKRRG